MKNINIAYALSFLYRSWFWLGIWVFYYLRFTDYAGIGLLETIMITTSTIGEIPTGAIADVIGKKKAVMAAFLLAGIGNLAMAFATNYPTLIASIILMTLGGAFYSGSLEALVYDTLLENKVEDTFQKVISRITTMQNLGMAVAGIAGGYLYQLNVSLPFILVAIAYFIGLIISFGLSEPLMDTEKYSWRIFVTQNIGGFKQLFSTKRIAYMTLLFLIPGAFMLATENLINDASAIELGFDSVQLGIFATGLYLFGILVSEKSEWIMSKLSSKWLYATLLIVYISTLIIMPVAGLALGGVVLFLRYGAATVFSNYESTRINAVIDSKYRATALSTFSLLRNIPYVFGATAIGLLMNLYTVRTFSLYFGMMAILSVGILYLSRPLFRDK